VILLISLNKTALGIFSDESSLQKIVPFLFLVARNYIHCCKWTDTVNSKTSKSKADESQILNEVQNLFATGQPHR
jgi:hypothetical protein